jgi:hypothetical protein
MEGPAILFDFLIKWGILALPILGLLRILSFRGDGKKHWFTKIVTFFSVILATFFLISNYRYRHSQLDKIAGDYKLDYYKCESCSDCIVRLKNDATYSLIRDGVEIDKGDWDFTENFGTIFLKIENGPKSDILDETRTISYIKNEECQEYWRKQNFTQAINGIIIRIDTAKPIYGVYPFVYIDSMTKDTFQYRPKYLGHPWLNEKISVGCLINKEKNNLEFKITKPNGNVVTVSEHNN